LSEKKKKKKKKKKKIVCVRMSEHYCHWFTFTELQNRMIMNVLSVYSQQVLKTQGVIEVSSIAYILVIHDSQLSAISHELLSPV
jgi:hypothetical protein